MQERFRISPVNIQLGTGLTFVMPFGLQEMYRLSKGIQVLELTNFPETAAGGAGKKEAQLKKIVQEGMVIAAVEMEKGKAYVIRKIKANADLLVKKLAEAIEGKRISKLSVPKGGMNLKTTDINWLIETLGVKPLSGSLNPD